MSDYSQISGEHIVSLFRDHARQYGPNHVTTKDCEAELLRRLRARSVEGLVGIKTEDLTEALQCMNRSQVLAEFRCREGQIDERTRDRWIAKVQRHIDSMLESAGWSKDRYKSNRAAIGCALQSAAGEGPLIPSANLTIVPANLLDAVIAAVEESPSADIYRDDYVVERKAAIAAIRAAWEGVTDGH